METKTSADRPPQDQRLAFKARVLIGILYGILKLLGITWRVRIEGIERIAELRTQEQSFIYAFWHQNMAVMTMFPSRYYPEYQGVVFSSKSKDGRKGAYLARLLGVQAVYGSSTQGGRGAIMDCLRLLKRGKSTVYMTIDGPQGPLHQCKPGIFMISKMGRIPIIPVCIEYERYWQASKSWDKNIIPKPFSRVYISLKPLVSVDPSASIADIDAMAAGFAEVIGTNTRYDAKSNT